MDKLSPADDLRMRQYTQRRFDRARKPVDKKEAEATLLRLFKIMDQAPMPIYWAASPKVAQVVMASLRGETNPNPTFKAGPKTLAYAKETLAQHGEELISFGTNTIENDWFAGDGYSNGWIAFYSFINNLLPGKITKEDNEKLHLLEILSDCASWIYTFDNATIMTERPISHWTTDDVFARPVLHNPKGPSVDFPDWKLYHWRGTRVPKQWIMAPETVNVKDAISWQDVDQRTALCEILGWGKILEHLDAKAIDVNPDPMFGTLFVADLPDAPGTKFLKARCGTGREVVVLADPAARTALEAGAMSYRVDVEIYKTLKKRG